MARVDAQIQRKNFERQLASAEQRLQAALAAAKMAVLEWEPVTDAVTPVTRLLMSSALCRAKRLAVGHSFSVSCILTTRTNILDGAGCGQRE